MLVSAGSKSDGYVSFLHLNGVLCLHPGMDVRFLQLHTLRCGLSSRPRKPHPGHRGKMVSPMGIS